jgi:hypothetical protein
MIRGLLVAGLVLSLIGCVGHLPANLKPSELTDQVYLVPTFREVKLFAYATADGYTDRASMNRHAINAGAVTVALGVAGMAAGAIYGAPVALMTAIPLVTGTLGSVGAIYQNDQKADLYTRAGGYVRALIDVADLEAAIHGYTDTIAAACLKRTLDEVIRRVDWHVTMLNPQNVVALLRALPPGAQLDKLLAAARGDFSDLDVPASGPPFVCVRGG